MSSARTLSPTSIADSATRVGSTATVVIADLQVFTVAPPGGRGRRLRWRPRRPGYRFTPQSEASSPAGNTRGLRLYENGRVVKCGVRGWWLGPAGGVVVASGAHVSIAPLALGDVAE